jgi:hypothetical protein
MGDAKRRRSICNGYRLEPFCTSVSIKTAGMPEEIELSLGDKLEEYWAVPSNTPALIKLLINSKNKEDRDIILHGGNSLCTTLISEFKDTIIQLQDSLTDTTIPEIQKILSDYNPQSEVLVISIAPVNRDPHINNLMKKYKRFAVVMVHKLDYKNIYS